MTDPRHDRSQYGAAVTVRQEFFDLVTNVDPEVRHSAHDRLADPEVPALWVLLEVLGREDAAYAWPECAELLRTVCQDGIVFHLMVKDMAAEPDDAVFGRLAAALGLPAGTRRPPEPDPGVYDDRRVWATVLVALLASPFEWVRQHAVRELAAEIGPGVAGTLRAARASRMPARRAAIHALAEIDWAVLGQADQALLQRLIRVKQRTEVPAPVVPQGEWYALPTTDQAAVLAAFDLRDPVPATLRMGFAPWQPQGPWQQLPWYCGYASSDTYEQVFVTPALDGWTLVFADGTVLAPDGTVPREEVRFAAAHRRCAELSRRFGTAHWYLHAGGGGCWDQSGWCVAEHGEVVRYCYHGHDVEGGVQTGPVDELRTWLDEHDPGTGTPPVRPEPAPAESSAAKFQAWLDDLFADYTPLPVPDDLEEEDDEEDDQEEPLPTHDEDDDEPWEFGALDVAWRLSVSPEALGPHTTVQGTGVLAIPAGKPDTRRYGALPI